MVRERDRQVGGDVREQDRGASGREQGMQRGNCTESKEALEEEWARNEDGLRTEVVRSVCELRRWISLRGRITGCQIHDYTTDKGRRKPGSSMGAKEACHVRQLAGSCSRRVEVHLQASHPLSSLSNWRGRKQAAPALFVAQTQAIPPK